MTKAKLRQQMIDLLKNLDKQNKQAIETGLIERLLSSKQWKASEVIALTISQPLEWSTQPIIEEGWKQGKKIVVPRCQPDEKKLQFYRFTSYRELEVVYYGLKEPKADPRLFVPKSSIDLVVVPGLVFDLEGYRIGFGGGYYDRFLADYDGVTISLLCEKQLVDEIPKEPFDIPVDHLITEKRFIK